MITPANLIIAMMLEVSALGACLWMRWELLTDTCFVLFYLTAIIGFLILAFSRNS